MNRQRIEEVRAMLASMPANQFDYGKVLDRASYSKCGFVGCVAGWGMIADKLKEGVTLLTATDRELLAAMRKVSPYENDFELFATDYFDIPYPVALALTYAEHERVSEFKWHTKHYSKRVAKLALGVMKARNRVARSTTGTERNEAVAALDYILEKGADFTSADR